MARSEIVTIGGILFFLGIIAFFYPVGDKGFTAPQIHQICSIDWIQFALMFDTEGNLRQLCNTFSIITTAIYGFVIVGIIVIIVGAVVSGKKEDDDSKKTVVAKEEKEETYQDILKQTITKEEKPKEEPAKVGKPKEYLVLPKEERKPNKTVTRGAVVAGVSVVAVIIFIFGVEEFSQSEIGNVQDKSISEQKGKIAGFGGEISEVYSCSGGAGCYTDFVTRIVDGDTIYTRTLKIRLALTNTPEINQIGYSEATQFTEKLCPVGSMILVDQDDLQKVDNYGRILAKVFCGNKVLNSELLYNGHASILTQYCFSSEFSGENWAKNYGCETPVQPYTPSEKETTSKENLCDPSYPALCIPSPPPDLDCGEIPYKNFRVSGSDPHRFDGDKDGIGCETSTYSPTPTPSKPKTQGTSCDPSYPDFCIPSPPPDLDCKDIAQKRFTVIGSDPHRFDGDKDGIGCES